MRELLLQARQERRELSLVAQQPLDTATLDASGAIELTLRDFLEQPENSLGLPPGLELQMGVDGNEVWPVSIDDAEMEEEREGGILTDQKLSFDYIPTAEPKRTGIVVDISNMAIDNAAFDLLGYVRKKVALAQRRYIARRLFSTAHFPGNNGPFSSKNVPTWHAWQSELSDSIRTRMTELHELGYDTTSAVLVMTPDVEVTLKLTPAAAGSGQMMIQGERCCGYPYVVNRYFNTEFDSDGQLVPRDSFALGIAIFKYFKIQQHGRVRVVLDGVSREVAARGVTTISINTAWSFTNLSEKMNGSARHQAFQTIIGNMAALTDCDGNIFKTSDGKVIRVIDNGNQSMRFALTDANGAPLQGADGNLLTVGLSQ